MRKYEIMYILNPEAEDIKGVQSKLHAILERDGGKIQEVGDWGKMDLAYPIAKKSKGYYTVIIVETASENVLEFERIARIERDVLRTLVINTEKEKNYIQTTKYAKTDVAAEMERANAKREAKASKYNKILKDRDSNKEASSESKPKEASSDVKAKETSSESKPKETESV